MNIATTRNGNVEKFECTKILSDSQEETHFFVVKLSEAQMQMQLKKEKNYVVKIADRNEVRRKMSVLFNQNHSL